MQGHKSLLTGKKKKLSLRTKIKIWTKKQRSRYMAKGQATKSRRERE
jgi:hypothetical protein